MAARELGESPAKNRHDMGAHKHTHPGTHSVPFLRPSWASQYRKYSGWWVATWHHSMCKNGKWQEWPLAQSHHLATEKEYQPGLLCAFYIEVCFVDHTLIQRAFRFVAPLIDLTFSPHPPGWPAPFVYFPLFMSFLTIWFFLLPSSAEELLPKEPWLTEHETLWIFLTCLSLEDS